jgi:DNA-binding NtrC family response regulator
MRELMAYDWPGNVRELTHVIARAAVMTSGEVIDAVSLPNSIRAPERRLKPSEELAALPLKEAMQAFERELIVGALERAGGNRSEAARQLGLARTHLYAKMDEHGIARDPKKPSGE